MNIKRLNERQDTPGPLSGTRPDVSCNLSYTTKQGWMIETSSHISHHLKFNFISNIFASSCWKSDFSHSHYQLTSKNSCTEVKCSLKVFLKSYWSLYWWMMLGGQSLMKTPGTWLITRKILAHDHLRGRFDLFISFLWRFLSSNDNIKPITSNSVQLL